MKLEPKPIQTRTKKLRCVRRSQPAAAALTSEQFPAKSLISELRSVRENLSSDEQEAFASIIPLLVCGEQSAVSVFNHALRRHQGQAADRLRGTFAEIERDEAGHELAWQTLHTLLPVPNELHALKRRAARFFANLGRAPTVGIHFTQIAHLDSAVGTMMWYLERSAIARDPHVGALARHIKQDEARHVAVSRHYARDLGVTNNDYRDFGAKLRYELVALLEPIRDPLEVIGIDSDQMLRRVAQTTDQRSR